MARVLEKQHKREREYYLRKTDSLDGKKVSDIREDYLKYEEKYDKKLERIKSAARDKAKSTVSDDRKAEPVATAVTFGVIDQVKVEPPTTENTALTSNTAQSGDTDSKEPPVTVTAKSDTDNKSTDKSKSS